MHKSPKEYLILIYRNWLHQRCPANELTHYLQSITVLCGILNQKLTIEEANASNYVFDLIRFSWVNDFTGAQVIDSKERFEGLANGEIDPYIVNEISRLALEANDFILTEESIESKKNYLNLN